MVSLQTRFSSLFLLRCAGLRLRFGAERFDGRSSTTRLPGEEGRALNAVISTQQLRAMEVMSSVMILMRFRSCSRTYVGVPAGSGWRGSRN